MAEDKKRGGVELELPTNGVSLLPDRRLFWGVGGTGALAAYEQAALQAIKFLQGLYGFMIRDYNFHCVCLYGLGSFCGCYCRVCCEVYG